MGSEENKNKADERRRGSRVEVNQEFSSLESSGVTYVSNLSVHGVFVHTNAAAEIGTRFDLKFTVLLEDPVVVEVPGRVVRLSKDPVGFGVEFEHPTAPQLKKIKDVLEATGEDVAIPGFSFSTDNAKTSGEELKREKVSSHVAASTSSSKNEQKRDRGAAGALSKGPKASKSPLFGGALSKSRPSDRSAAPSAEKPKSSGAKTPSKSRSRMKTQPPGFASTPRLGNESKSSSGVTQGGGLEASVSKKPIFRTQAQEKANKLPDDPLAGGSSKKVEPDSDEDFEDLPTGVYAAIDWDKDEDPAKD